MEPKHLSTEQVNLLVNDMKSYNLNEIEIQEMTKIIKTIVLVPVPEAFEEFRTSLNDKFKSMSPSFRKAETTGTPLQQWHVKSLIMSPSYHHINYHYKENNEN